MSSVSLHKVIPNIDKETFKNSVDKVHINTYATADKRTHYPRGDFWGLREVEAPC